MVRTVLAADDSPQIRKMLSRLFGDEEDYDLCAQATNGQEAIDLALKCRPELIILDLSMPVMNGLDAARELKRLMPEVPIILFTQHANVGSHLFGENPPVDRIVSKEDASHLIGHVRSLTPV
jgi:chemotaxis response regulator CheB